MTPSVVCGVDHSSHARTAAAFAAHFAERLGLRLILVHALPATVPPLAPEWPTRAAHDPADVRRSRHRAGRTTRAVFRREWIQVLRAVGERSPW
jgi:nucleotide-binding universal stress UspA family protein